MEKSQLSPVLDYSMLWLLRSYDIFVIEATFDSLSSGSNESRIFANLGAI